MGNFIEAFNITNKSEGGYSNNPSDNGGETFAGISRKNWPNWDGWKFIDQYKETTGLAGIDKTMFVNPFMQQYIHDFYKQNFWDVLKLDQINDQQICNTVYDFGVNSGTGRSAKLLQEVVGVTSDGQIGPHTIEAVNNSDPETTYANFNHARWEFYTDLAKNPGQGQFLNSWLSRLTPYK